MIVEKDKVVSIDYRLEDADGNLIDTSAGKAPLSYLHGAGNIIPGLEAALEQKSEGDTLTVVVEPKDGYGVRDDSQIAKVSRDNLSGINNIQVGMQLQAQTPQGPRIVRIADMDDETVTIDANHVLAGVTLHFDVEVKEIREATAEELQHGHVHGPGGHQH